MKKIKRLFCITAIILLIGSQAAVSVFAETKTAGEPNTVNANMSAAEIQKIISENEKTVFQAGTYKDLKILVPEHSKKILQAKDSVVFEGRNGNAMELKKDADLTLDGGTFEIKGYETGIQIASEGDHTFTLKNGTLNCHDLSKDYGKGGFSVTSPNGGSIRLNFEKGTTFICKNSYSGIEINNNSDKGTSVYTTFKECELIDLSNNGRDNSGSGIQAANSTNVYQEIVFSGCKTVRLEKNHLDAICVQSSQIGKSKITINNCPDISLSQNKSWGTNGGIVELNNSKLNINENGAGPWTNVRGTASNLYCYELTAKNSEIRANGAGSNCGIWVAGPAVITDCQVEANGNAVQAAEGYYAVREGYENAYYSNYAYYSGNGCYFGGETKIQNSVIRAEGNGGSGIAFRNDVDDDTVSVVEGDSRIFTAGNGVSEKAAGRPDTRYLYTSGITVLFGELEVKNSFISSTGNKEWSISYYNDDKNQFFDDYKQVVKADGTSVLCLDSAKEEAIAGSRPQETYMLNGSLQAKQANMTGTYGSSWNKSKEAAEVYAGPINQFKTKLVRFDLHKDVNKECTKDSNTFKTCDPNKGQAYDYSFRYNKKGEDLDGNTLGNAYVWTPVSILNYDATEGSIDEIGSAGQITPGDSITSNGDAAKGKRRTSDITIFGNSLDLAEKNMPTAVRDGYVFLGWYYADDEGAAAELAEAGQFETLYELLNTEFTSASKAAAGKSDDPADGVAEKTIYAKWAPEAEYYRTGEIEVEKRVTENGQPYQVNTTFYAGLFEDEACSIPTKNADGNPIILPLEMGGADTISVKQDQIPLGTHYVAETDKDGTPVHSSDGHTVSIDRSQINIGPDTEAVKVTIINEYGDYEGFYREEGGNSGDSEIVSTAVTTIEEEADGEKAVKTGDDTNLALYVVLLILASIAAATVIATGRRKKNIKNKSK